MSIEAYRRLRRHLAATTDYEKQLKVAYGRATFDLDRVERLMDRLGRPERGLGPVVHVAGTKGKGSTSTMIASILGAAGRRVGLYTSPHLVWLGERLRVDGHAAAPEDLGRAFERLEPALDELGRAGDTFTFFEVLTAVAFLHFEAARVDAAVIEVGLGGRLDATNVVRPAACAITSIGLDHTAQLGTTEEAIAGEKAGIVKAGVPVVTGVADGPARARIEAVAAERGAPLSTIGRDFEATVHAAGEDGVAFDVRTWRRPHDDLRIRLAGRHQAWNAAVATAVAERLDESGAVRLPGPAVRAGLAAAWIDGRFHVVPGPPPVVVDGAHNPGSIEALARAFAEVYPGARPAVIFGALRDKDVAGMVRALVRLEPRFVVTTPVGSPRETPAAELAERFLDLGVETEAADGPARALEIARTGASRPPGAGGPERVLVCGSIYLAGEVLRRLGVLAAPARAED